MDGRRRDYRHLGDQIAALTQERDRWREDYGSIRLELEGVTEPLLEEMAAALTALKQGLEAAERNRDVGVGGWGVGYFFEASGAEAVLARYAAHKAEEGKP